MEFIPCSTNCLMFIHGASQPFGYVFFTVSSGTTINSSLSHHQPHHQPLGSRMYLPENSNLLIAHVVHLLWTTRQVRSTPPPAPQGRIQLCSPVD
jgi:hypothetical protein